MRVTQGMLSNNMLRNLMNSQTRMSNYMEQLYTGKKISRPSQDPVIAVKGINYRTQVSQVEQYKRNTGEIHNWMDNSDAALDKATQAMQRLRELAIQASNDPYGEEERESIRQEVEQLKQHLIDVANTNVNGKYIFNGTNTEEAPIQASEDADGEFAIEFNTDAVNIAVSNQTVLQANVNAENVFSVELFEHIDLFMERLETASEDGNEIGQSIADLDVHINHAIDARAELGARMNRLELVENRLDEQKVIATRTMSENEDVHMEEAITNLITQESLHRAALAAGSRVIQPTLIDFLR